MAFTLIFSLELSVQLSIISVTELLEYLPIPVTYLSDDPDNKPPVASIEPPLMVIVLQEESLFLRPIPTFPLPPVAVTSPPLIVIPSQESLLAPQPIPAPLSPPVAVTFPPLMVIAPQELLLDPQPIPAAPSPPVAVTFPPLMVIAPQELLSDPQPIPAPPSPPVTVIIPPLTVILPPELRLSLPIPALILSTLSTRSLPVSSFSAFFCCQIVRLLFSKTEMPL